MCNENARGATLFFQVLFYGKTDMQITELLRRVHAGDQEALNSVIPLVYGELKKLAAGH